MRGKRAEALLDALLVADIGEHVRIDRQLRAIERGHVHTGLSHQAEQTDSLERDGLAAGVRTGDHHHVEIVAEAEVNRHDAACQQWMPRLLQTQPSGGIDLWRRRLNQAGVARLGEV